MAKKKPAPAKAVVTKPTGPARPAATPAAPVEPAAAPTASSSAATAAASAATTGASAATAAATAATQSPSGPSSTSSTSTPAPKPLTNGAVLPGSADAGSQPIPVAAASTSTDHSTPRARHPLPTGRIPVSGDGPVRTTQALEHGAAAYGARFLKPGFATTPAGDLAFALGFPHLEYIVDDHPDDARAEMIAYERRSYRLGWPRNVAIRWCRITASKGFKRTPQGATELDPAGKKAIKNGAPLAAEEVMLSLKAMLSDTTSYEDLRELVRLFEAFTGPDLVATSIVDALEKSGNNVWNHQDHDRAQVVHHLGFMLLRLPASITEKLRARLAAIFERRVKALPNKELGPRKGERGSLLRALDVVLHGRAGSERSGERSEDAIEPGDLLHVTGDEAYVREAACRVVSPDARLVF